MRSSQILLSEKNHSQTVKKFFVYYVFFVEGHLKNMKKILTFIKIPYNIHTSVFRKYSKSMPRWWNGRHVRLRCVCRKVCEFESHLGHQYLHKTESERIPFFYLNAQVVETYHICLKCVCRQKNIIQKTPKKL